MRIFFKTVKFFCFLTMIALNISCQSQRDHNQTKNQEIAPSKTKTQNGEINVKVGNDGQRVLMNVHGWKLPSLLSFSQNSKGLLGNNPRSEIEFVEYLPTEDVVQIADGNTFENVDRDPDIEEKSWLVRQLKVFSVKGKPFCYVLRGNLIKTDSEGKIEARLAMSAVLVYSDQDGDGIFESFRYSSSESPSIPGWVREFR